MPDNVLSSCSVLVQKAIKISRVNFVDVYQKLSVSFILPHFVCSYEETHEVDAGVTRKYRANAEGLCVALSMKPSSTQQILVGIVSSQ